MADVLNSLGIEYLAINCASSYRGLHEAVINHAATPSPRSSPASMKTSRSTWRRAMPRSKASRWPWPATASSACSTRRWRCTTPGAIACRSWSSAAISWRPTSARPARNGCIPASISARSSASSPNGTTSRPRCTHFGESTVRAYKIATTPPMGPVFIALDAELQENPIPDAESLRIPKFAPVIPPQGDAGAIAEAAKMLVEAQEPDHHLRSRGPHARRHGQSRGAGRGAAMRCHRQRRPHEFPVAASAQSELPPGDDRSGRRHPRASK